MTLESVAKALLASASFFGCSFKTAWQKYMHPAITDKFTYEEVVKHIEEGAGAL